MLLDVRNLQVRFDRHGQTVHAVNGLSFKVGKGDVLAIVGESGAGKSQACLALTGLLPENATVSGEVWLESGNLMTCKTRDLENVRGAKIAYVFQDPMTALNPYLRIDRQLLEVIERHRGLDRDAARREAETMLELVRIPDPAIRMRQYPHQLSGGQRQRVMLAMALLGRPKLLIADEPTTALDVTVQRQILDLLKTLQQELDFSLVIITHDLGVVAHIARHVAVMYAGRIVETAAVHEIFRNPRHPYTRGLIAAAPKLHGGIPAPIPGVPPRLDRLPQGCAFAPRCAHVSNRCQQTVPEIELENEHRVVCQPEVVHE